MMRLFSRRSPIERMDPTELRTTRIALQQEQRNSLEKVNRLSTQLLDLSKIEQDTDSDGLTDGAEVLTHKTSPLNPDTDGDGLKDGKEVLRGTNPTRCDTDSDIMCDGRDPIPKTNNGYIYGPVFLVFVSGIMVHVLQRRRMLRAWREYGPRIMELMRTHGVVSENDLLQADIPLREAHLTLKYLKARKRLIPSYQKKEVLWEMPNKHIRRSDI